MRGRRPASSPGCVFCVCLCCGREPCYDQIGCSISVRQSGCHVCEWNSIARSRSRSEMLGLIDLPRHLFRQRGCVIISITSESDVDRMGLCFRGTGVCCVFVCAVFSISHSAARCGPSEALLCVSARTNHDDRARPDCLTCQ